MVKRNIVDDFGTIFKLSSKQTSYMVDIFINCICEAIRTAKAQNESILVLDLGVSSLSINLEDGSWKSVPSKPMKSAFGKSISSSQPEDLLVESLTEAIAAKLNSIINEVV